MDFLFPLPLILFEVMINNIKILFLKAMGFRIYFNLNQL